MSTQPGVVFCFHEVPGCPLLAMLRRAAEASAQAGDGDGGRGGCVGDGVPLDTVLGMVSGVAARVLRVQRFPEEGFTEAWIRVSGSNGAVEAFEAAMRQEDGVAFQRVFSNKFSTIYRVVISMDRCPCEKSSGNGARGPGCPLLYGVPGAMNKATVVTPRGFLCEFIVAKTRAVQELRRRGCRILVSHEVSGYDYMLTEKQELAVIYAYLMGYYQFPRKASLKELATKLGLSVSTLAELLRKAEAKIIEAYIRHELPHYLVGVIMSPHTYRGLLEKRFNKRREEEAKPIPAPA